LLSDEGGTGQQRDHRRGRHECTHSSTEDWRRRGPRSGTRQLRKRAGISAWQLGIIRRLPRHDGRARRILS
jgi:hypothetical protein